MKFQWLLIWKYFKGESKAVRTTSILASFGIILGVSCLIVSMAIVTGVQKFIQDSIIDLTGHVLITRPSGKIKDIVQLEKDLQGATKDFVALSPFVHAQGVIVREGHISGVILHGLEEESMGKVLNLKPRVLEGNLVFQNQSNIPQAALGKGLAKKLNLKLGDEFKVIVPRPSKTKITNFSPVKQAYKLSAIMDYGKFEYNEKVLITSVQSIRQLAGIDDVYLGAYIKLKNANQAIETAQKFRDVLGADYRVRDWHEVNYNFFTAVELEKVVIFIVVLFIVIVASFNISSSLFVSVMRKFVDIAILKTLGANKAFIRKLFTLQGLILGFAGATLGTILGLVLCFILSRYNFIDIPGDIYKFDRLPIEVSFRDVTIIYIVTVVICYLSSLIPARKGAQLIPIKGLRYE